MKLTTEAETKFVLFGAVVASMPRWIAANLTADGLTIPPGWIAGWTIFAILAAAAMALVEAAALHLAFGAWRKTSGRTRTVLMTLIVVSIVSFVGVLAPSVQANAQGARLADVLHPAAAWAWSLCASASTMLIVGVVGYAQGAQERTPEHAERTVSVSDAPQLREVRLPVAALGTGGAVTCERCGRTFGKSQALSAHKRFCGVDHA